MSDRLTPAVPERSGFGSNFGFIMAAVGSAVGLGNLWKFPYITGEYGGGAFVLVYLGCILLVGLPLMYAEIIIGQRGGKDVLGAMRDLTDRAGILGKVISYAAGILAVLSGILILSFYAVVAGWAIHFFGISLGFGGGDLGAEGVFGAVAGNAKLSTIYHSIIMLLTVGVVTFSIHSGIERLCKILMPILFVILTGLLIYVAVTGGLDRSLTYLFRPDFEKLSGEAVLEALGHAFFTLSLGMGAMVTYGSYLKSERRVLRDGVTIAFLDTLIALMAGAVIFAICFSHDQDPAAGPGLVFVTLPTLFSVIPGGQILSAIFFLLVIFAAWSSAVSLLEVAVSYFVDEWKIPRAIAAWSIGLLIWALGLLSACGISTDTIGLNQGSFLDFFDNLTTNYMLPIGGLLVAIAAGWLLSRDDRNAGFDAVGVSAKPLAGLWTVLIRYVTPVLVVLVILWKINVISFKDPEPSEDQANRTEMVISHVA